MKLLFVCLLAGMLSVHAEVSSQVYSLSLKNAPLRDVIRSIEKQGDYRFFFSDDVADLNRPVQVDVSNATIDQILTKVLSPYDLGYKMLENNLIIISPYAVMSEIKQGITVTGTVTDNAGEPMPGVNIQIKGTLSGSVTDVNGKYTIAVPDREAILVFSFIGYASQEITVGDQRAIEVTLAEETKLIDEVVVVGFGTQRKANLTGAVSQVKMDEVLGDRPVINVTTALQGAVPGLLVSGNHKVGQSKDLQIRGAYTTGSLNADGTAITGAAIAPLVLIDNVEGDLSMLNPDDIASISILKDAASAAIYGARASAGVIIVTTKTPKKGTKFTLNYNNNLSFQNAINLPEQVSLDDYFNMYRETGASNVYWAAGQKIDRWLELLKQYREDPGSMNIIGDGIYKDTDGAVYYLRERDPYKQLVETSFMQNHNISVSGASDRIRFRISGGLSSQDGPIVTNQDKYERKNISGFVSGDVTSWFTQEIDIKYAASTLTNPTTDNGLFSTRLLSYTPEGMIPASLYGLDKDYPLETSLTSIKYSGLPKTTVANPRIFSKSIIKPVKGLEIIFEYTFDKKDTRYDYYTNQYTATSIQQSTKKIPGTISYTKEHYFTDYNSINLYGNYGISFGDHNFKVMGGYNQEQSYYESLKVVVEGQEVLEVPSLAGGNISKNPTDTYREYALRGVFYRFNYNYKNKYLFEANGRYDGSSKFPKDNRFGFFPSFSAGWNVAEESFMESLAWLSALKLRISWGKLGNQNIPAYVYMPTMSRGVWKPEEYKAYGWPSGSNWLNNGTQVTFVNPPGLVSNNFTWETSEKLDPGIDFAMFNSRLTGTVEWYQNITRGMLAPGMALPGIIGGDPPFQNTADMRTRGWEFSMNWNDRIGEVGYHIGFNLSDYKQAITKYDQNATSKILTLNDNGTSKTYFPDMVLGDIWGYVADGFYTINDFEDAVNWKLKNGVTTIQGITNTLRPGDMKYKNLSDADGTTNEVNKGSETAIDPGDRKVIGNTTPRYQFGANLGVNYKGFDLSVMLQGVGKRDYWLGNAAYLPFQAGDMFTGVMSNQADYWKPVDAANGNYNPVNPDAKLGRIYNQATANTWGNNGRVSDKLVSNAAYMRIKNITLSYSLPQHILQKARISGLRLFVTVENLATFTSLPKGYDPETLSWTFPAYRTTSFGLSLNL